MKCSVKSTYASIYAKSAISAIERRLTGNIRGYQLIPESVRDRLVEMIKELVAERIPERINDISPNLANKLIGDLDIAEHLEQRISNWPVEDVERVTWAVAGREMRGIELAGAALGFLVGLIHAVISLF